MPKLQYAGLKKGPIGETAFIHETGVTWFPGTVKNIPQAIAVRMLVHRDVFMRVPDDVPEDDGDPSPHVEELAQPSAQVQEIEQDEDLENLTPAQRRMAAFAAGDKGNEDEFALGAGEAGLNPEGATTQGAAPAADTGTGENNAPADLSATSTGSADTSGMTLAPGGTVQAASAAPEAAAAAGSAAATAPAPTAAPAAVKPAGKAAAKTPAKGTRGGK